MVDPKNSFLINGEFYEQSAWVVKRLNTRIGRYLDIGANDGIHNSNTLLLCQAGWRGVLFEPAPNTFKELVKHYGSLGLLDRTTMVEKAVIPDEQPDEPRYLFDYQDLNTAGSAKASLDQDWAIRCNQIFNSDRGTVHKVKVNVMRCCDLIAAYGYDFDMVSIDAEGMDLEIARCLPWAKMSTRLACIEHFHNWHDLAKIMRENKFAHQCTVGGNAFWGRKL